MNPALLSAKLGLQNVAGVAHKPVAQPPIGPGNHKPAPHAAQGKLGPGASLLAAHAAHKQGDHAGAKKHALRAVNQLHRMSAAPVAPSAPVASVAAPAAPSAGGAV